MDLNAANLADGIAGRLTRASMIACFVVASAMLLASLAMAKGTAGIHNTSLSASTEKIH
jgi:hypothetical protein